MAMDGREIIAQNGEVPRAVPLDYAASEDFNVLFLDQNSSYFENLAEELGVPFDKENAGFCVLATVGMTLSSMIHNPEELSQVIFDIATRWRQKEIITDSGAFKYLGDHVFDEVNTILRAKNTLFQFKTLSLPEDSLRAMHMLLVTLQRTPIIFSYWEINPQIPTQDQELVGHSMILLAQGTAKVDGEEEQTVIAFRNPNTELGDLGVDAFTFDTLQRFLEGKLFSNDGLQLLIGQKIHFLHHIDERR